MARSFSVSSGPLCRGAEARQGWLGYGRARQAGGGYRGLGGGAVVSGKREAPAGRGRKGAVGREGELAATFPGAPASAAAPLASRVKGITSGGSHLLSRYTTVRGPAPLG
ncbi:MAG: hypothetical protein D9V47_06275 [Clostridia bacterium]|nr:MAG: hypothetical protein D9V47_06275 [Clostridia bacterium]